jgi:Cu/Zn superoxide dismutase
MKNIAILVVALAAAIASAAAFAASADTVKVGAKLTVAAEVPKSHAPAAAGGTFTATVNEKTRTVTWKLTYSHLTGAGFAAHIHKGKPGVPGPVIVSLCGPCHSGQSGTAHTTEAIVKSIRAGSTYVNVHTKRNPNGEIRGQVKVTG